jgi:ribonuclease J
MIVTIHRGTRQIGGCLTEIASNNAKVFIDFGADLPGNSAPEPASPIDGLTAGGTSESALFFTHYHGDHTGRLVEVLPEIPVYMGETAKALYLTYARRVRDKNLAAIERIQTFSQLDKINIGGISITPLMIDHSAFDAYMFIIEAEGKRVLHTGDFRLHGFRGGKTLDMLRRYAPDIDCIICENTTLSRGDAPVFSERELQNKARAIMKANKHVFVLCGSTNIDRIGAFYHANPVGRLFVCDSYQKSQLEIVRNRHAAFSDFYDFSHVYSYAPNLDTPMDERGFCMIIRQGDFFAKLLKRYKDRSKIIYSMWSGYLKGDSKNDRLVDFLSDYEFVFLHTSGHANPQDLAQLYEVVKPKIGVIPIHGNEPERFRKLIPDGRIILLNDGEKYTV